MARKESSSNEKKAEHVKGCRGGGRPAEVPGKVPLEFWDVEEHFRTVHDSQVFGPFSLQLAVLVSFLSFQRLDQDVLFDFIFGQAQRAVLAGGYFSSEVVRFFDFWHDFRCVLLRVGLDRVVFHVFPSLFVWLCLHFFLFPFFWIFSRPLLFRFVPSIRLGRFHVVQARAFLRHLSIRSVSSRLLVVGGRGCEARQALAHGDDGGDDVWLGRCVPNLNSTTTHTRDDYFVPPRKRGAHARTVREGKREEKSRDRWRATQPWHVEDVLPEATS
mmetsp:Transcript_2393/g.16078  ORF Transcript_2393/g.16078 Transcript_2393/m.16078 type:complete len:272 (-) Transcript_2393:782-1597(-)